MPPSDAAPGDDRSGTWIERAAPAKLNLSLKVVGRRADGYHLLDSLVAFASVGDRIRVAPAARLTVHALGRFAADVPAGDAAGDNLVVRAARLLADAVGRAPDVAIELEKSLPVAAGLGGGSADAAATLRALADLWKIEEDGSRLSELAVQLGADVPVCLACRTSRMRGIGDEIAPAPSVAGLPVLLVNPGVPVATPEVFRELAGRVSEPADQGDPPQGPAALAGWLAGHGNDLQAPAIRLAPVIGDVLAAIEAEAGCLLSRMSGSGATCFGLFETAERCTIAATRIRTARLDWWAESGRLI